MGANMRSAFIPRLRQSAEVAVSVITNNDFKKVGNLMKEDSNVTKTSEITPEKLVKKNPRKQFKHKVNPSKGSQRGAGVQGDQSGNSSESKRVTATGFNVFYPVVRLGDRHKYSVSHYEVNLTPVELLNASINPNRYLAIETDEAIQSVIKCGGPEFHRRVMMAATQANAKFLVTTGNILPLINAFYGHMYNSRILYSLLCTAWRCQNQVNVIDEDQVYFSPLLNDHRIRNFSEGYAPSTFARETDATTFTTNTVRQGYCFADPTSNGVWANSVVTPILQYTRLTEGWKKWIEEKFMRTYVVDPTDFNVAPRFVEFWPSGAGVTASGTEGLEQFTAYTAYADQDYDYSSNSTIQNLIAFINTVATHQARFVADYPQLDLMWEYLGMSSSSTNFSRDLDAKSLPVVHSFSVSKFIESCAASCLKYLEQYTNAVDYYFNHPFSVYIARDPQAQENSFKTFEMASSSRTVANLTYLDRTELDECDFALCTGLIAPISYTTMIYNSSNNPYVWNFPLCSIMTYPRVDAITPQSGQFGGSIANFVTAINELNAINSQQGPVLSRRRMRLYGWSNAATAGTTNIPALREGNGTLYGTLPYFDLKDYYVPSYEATGWKDEYLDTVLTAKQ